MNTHLYPHTISQEHEAMDGLKTVDHIAIEMMKAMVIAKTIEIRTADPESIKAIARKSYELATSLMDVGRELIHESTGEFR